MKSVGDATEPQTAEEQRAALAAQFLQESEYLPPRGDQSWRELAALRIAPGRTESDIDATPDADMVPARTERTSEREVGHRGRILIPLLMALIVLPVIAVLTVPDMLTPAFWRGHDVSGGIMAKNAIPPAHTADSTAPVAVPPAAVTPPPATEAAPTAEQAPPPQSPPDHLRGTTASNAPPQVAPKPQAAPRLAEHAGPQDRGAGLFRALVVEPDGTFKYQYFPADPAPRGTEREEATKDDGNGFYAMAPDENGTLRYRYFPSKPSR